MRTCAECGVMVGNDTLSECPACRKPLPAVELPDPPAGGEVSASSDPPKERPLLAVNLLWSDREPEPDPQPSRTERPIWDAPDARINTEDDAQLSGDGLFTIGLLGFPTSGKTWFLNRLKQTLTKDEDRAGTFHIDPPAADEGMRVEGTFGVYEHTFENYSDPAASFRIIDIQGEIFRRGVAGRFSTADAAEVRHVMRHSSAFILLLPAAELLFADDTAPSYDLDRSPIDERLEALRQRREQLKAELKPLLLSLETQAAGGGEAQPHERREAEGRKQQCDDLEREQALLRSFADLTAMRLHRLLESRDGVGKAERALIKRERALLKRQLDWLQTRELREARREIDGFLAGVARLAALLAPDAPDNVMEMTEAEFRQRMRGRAVKPTTRPLYVAFSKADLLFPRPDWLEQLLRRRGLELRNWDGLDLDPAVTLKSLQPGIYKALRRNFAWRRFDFLSAFPGHDGSTRISYRPPGQGVQAVIDWIWWAHDRAQRKRSRWYGFQVWSSGVWRYGYERLSGRIVAKPKKGR